MQDNHEKARQAWLRELQGIHQPPQETTIEKVCGGVAFAAFLLLLLLIMAIDIPGVSA